eukprot:4756_1
MKLPDIWPVFNIINIILLDENKAKGINDRDTYVWYYELIVRHLRLSTYLIVASIVYYFTFPSYSQLLILDISLKWWIKWFAIIFIRDQFVTYFFYASWHYILYDSKLSLKMKKLKFNPSYPDNKQWQHDRFWSLNGALISTLFELFMIWFYRKYNVINLLHQKFNYFNIYNILWILFIPYWRDFHFYWIHRFMHPWNFNIFGIDIGRFCYRSIHSLHHKSYNTGPWSGLSMHPVEHIFYYSCMFVPTIFGIKQHPIHMLFNKFHAQLSPLPGHDGFDSPGGGSYFHYLHHEHYECNYGKDMVPLYKLFGCFE